MADRLTLAHAFEDAGMERAKAERVAGAVFDAIHDTTATQADVTSLGTELKAEMASLGADLRAAMANLRTELRAEMAALRTELKADIDRLRYDLIIRGIGALFTGLGALFAALHYWPPHP